MSIKCPHCGKVAYPAKNDDGSINWKNILRVDWLTLVLVLGIISLLIGVRMINQQCYDIVSDPCKKIDVQQCLLSNNPGNLPLIGDSAASPTNFSFRTDP